MMKLGVNIDHVATLRQARRGAFPDPVLAAEICEKAGAHSIVCHLREDRRHIQDQDVHAIRKAIRRMNLELSLDRYIIGLASCVHPDIATIVPERREEVTTEGGLDVIKNFAKVKKTVSFLQNSGIEVSLFIAPDQRQIKMSRESGATTIELHTGCYAHATPAKKRIELKKLALAASYAKQLGLKVSAGHGLDYENTQAITAIKEIEELNIGHSIISEAVFIGLKPAVKKMLQLVKKR